MKDVVEVVRRCRYCKREHEGSAMSYQENPFCRHCLEERLSKFAVDGEWSLEGHYAIFTPKADKDGS